MPTSRPASKNTASNMQAGKGKSWNDKLNDPTKVHQLKKLDKDFADMPANSKMLIATPKIIDEYVKQIPKGSSSSLATMRRDLANEFGADYTCPVTSGIFLRIVSEAAHEQLQTGISINNITPFWRVVDEKSPLNKKLTFGEEFVKNQRKKEGI